MSTDSPIEIHEVIRHTLPEPAIDWFLQSELAGDPATAAVVKKLAVIQAASVNDLECHDVMALEAAYLHRALQVATIDGAPVEDFAQIPGPLHEMQLEVLRGCTSRAAMRKHCTTTETRGAAALLNMAMRWTAGKAASAWSFETLRRGLTDNPHHLPRGMVWLVEFDKP